MDLKQTILDRSVAYCAGRGISKARLATIVVNDGKFFVRIEAGGGFTIETYQKFMSFFDEQEKAAA